MNNQPLVEAYKSFSAQGREKLAAGNYSEAREAFLKAAELANKISVASASYEVRMEYHNAAVKLLEFAKNGCRPAPERVPAAPQKDEEKPAEIKPSAGGGITFADVAGLEDVKDQIRYKVIEPLKNPELAAMYKIEPGAKILLYGPPGTGKTFIARAIAGEVDAQFYAVNCQDLISKYMGDSSKKLDGLFETAQKNERAIIFFDEFDSVASKRGDGADGVDAEMARFVATFLTKVDGFKRSKINKMLLLIAATNLLTKGLLNRLQKLQSFQNNITLNYLQVANRVLHDYLCKDETYKKFDNRSIRRFYNYLLQIFDLYGWEKLNIQYVFVAIVCLFIERFINADILQPGKSRNDKNFILETLQLKPAMNNRAYDLYSYDNVYGYRQEILNEFNRIMNCMVKNEGYTVNVNDMFLGIDGLKILKKLLVTYGAADER